MTIVAIFGRRISCVMPVKYVLSQIPSDCVVVL